MRRKRYVIYSADPAAAPSWQTLLAQFPEIYVLEDYGPLDEKVVSMPASTATQLNRLRIGWAAEEDRQYQLQQG
jgi:hypothetical protein